MYQNSTIFKITKVTVLLLPFFLIFMGHSTIII